MDTSAVESLHSLVEESMSEYEDKLAVIYDDGEVKEFLTYKQLWSTATMVMDALSRFSVGGEVIGMCLDLDKYTPAFILGVLRAGAAFYNFEANGQSYVSQVLQEIHVRVLIVARKHISKLQDLIVRFDGKYAPFDIPECPDVVLVHLPGVNRKCHLGNLAYCITTSGTTGKPKVVQVPHGCIVPNITHVRDIYKLTFDDLVLLCSPLTFDPSIVELFTSLSVGACILIVPVTVKVNPDKLLEVIFYRNRVTVMQCTPALLRRFNPTKVKETILGKTSALRVLSLGGERFPSCTEIQKLRVKGNQTTIFNIYGITEVSCWAMCYQVTDFSVDEAHLGYPLKDTEVKVCDERGKTITEGIGRIYIGGTSRQCIIGSSEERGYDVTVTRWHDTGDYGRVTKEGLIYYVGREDSQIKRLGKRLNLEEINQVVTDIAVVQICSTQVIGDTLVVFIVKDKCFDDLGAVSDNIITFNEGADRTALRDIVIKKIRSSLPGHYIPDHVIQIDSLPITKHGKLDQKELASIYKTQISSKKKDPHHCLETFWKDILCPSCDVISDESLFIEMGGNSLKAIQLLDELELELNCKMPQLLDLILGKPFKIVKDYIETILLNKEVLTVAETGNHVEERRKQNITSADEKDDLELTNLSDNYIDSSINSGNDMETDLSEVRDDSNLNYTESEDTKHLHFDNVTSRKLNTYFNKDIPIIDTHALSSNDEIVDFSNKHWNTVKQKRILAVNHDQYKIKKVKYNEIRRIFYKFIQRGNRIYEISAKTIGKEEVLSGNNNISQLDKINEIIKDGRQIRIELKERWRYNTGKCVDASPLVAIARENEENVVYIGSHSHKFCAISMATGASIWETTLGDRIESSAALSLCGNYIIVGCYDGHVYVLDTNTGDIYWQYQTGSEVKSSPTVDMATGLAYIGSHSQHVYALNIKERMCGWKVHLKSGSIFSSPVISYKPHHVTVGTLGGWLISLSATNGTIVWRCHLGKPIFSSPSVSSHGILVGCVDSCLYCIDNLGSLLWKFKTDGPIFSSPAIWNWFYEPSESISKYKQVPPGPSSKNIVCNLADPDVSDFCDKHYKSRMRKDDNIECEMSIDINDENTVISHNCNENVIFGSHDGSVYCVSNLGKLVWKIDVESPVYSTPFSGLITIKGKCNDNPNTICLEKDKLAETSGDEPNIMIDQNSIVESDEKGIVIGDKCFNPNTLGMVKTPQSFDHSECIRVEGAENFVNESSIANEQNHEKHTKEGGKYTTDENKDRNIDVKIEAINKYRSIDVKNDAFDDENQNIGVKTEDADNGHQSIGVKNESVHEYQSIDVRNDAVDNENGNMDVKTEDVDKENQTIDIKSKEVYNGYQKTDVEADIVGNVHRNSFLTNEDIDIEHQNSDLKTEYVDNKHQISDIKIEDVSNEYLNMDLKSESVDQNIGVKQKAVDQNIGVRQQVVDQNISVKSDTSDESNVRNSEIDKTQSVAIATFATTTGIIYVVGAEDGQVLYKIQMEGEVFSSPILYRNSLVVGCRDDNVYCFDINAE